MSYNLSSFAAIVNYCLRLITKVARARIIVMSIYNMSDGKYEALSCDFLSINVMWECFLLSRMSSAACGHLALAFKNVFVRLSNTAYRIKSHRKKKNFDSNQININHLLDLCSCIVPEQLVKVLCVGCCVF